MEIRDSMRDDLLDAAIEEWRHTARTSRIKASGLSMAPLITNGAWLVVEHKDSGDVRVGDIVIYRHEGSLVTHRVIDRRVRSDGGVDLVEQGDAGGGVRTIPAEAFFGRVAAIETDLGRIDLDSGRWRWMGSLIGAYWQGLHRVDRNALALKRLLVRGLRIPGAGRLHAAIMRAVARPPRALLRLAVRVPLSRR